MFSLFKNDSKSEKTEKKSHNSSVTNTKENGNSISKSVTLNKLEYASTASHVSTTRIVHNGLTPSFERSILTRSLNTKTFPDGTTTFKGAPPRSAFTSTPLTIKSPSPYVSKTSVDAKPFVPSNFRTPTNPGKVATKTPLHSNVSNIEPNPTLLATELRVKLQIKVKKSVSFSDDQRSIVPVYKTRSKYRGKLLLINNIKFVHEKEVRKGAELDETNISELFKQMGFEVVRHRNLTKKDLMAKVGNFRKDKTLNKFDIATVIIMSHGTGKERSDSTEIVCTDGERLPTTMIINEFDSAQCPQLNGKPKIFIFQCCRGEQYDMQYDGVPIVSRKLSDMLIAYATIPGFVAHRDPVNGTWYIQAICKVFMDHAHNTDVERLLKIVDNELSSLITTHGSKQTSSFENRGFKTCFLHPQLYE